MECTLIKAKDLKPVAWSGGSTTELFIFPPTGNYRKRNFDFRLSTATVEVDTSDFLPALVDGNHSIVFKKEIQKNK